MAMLADCVHQIAEANWKLGGSFKTQQNRRHLVTPFLRFARELKGLHRSLADIEPWTIQFYAVHCIVAGMTPGNLENIFSAIRVVLKACGNNVSKSCSSRKLGLPPRIRAGARRAQSPEEIEALLARTARIHEGLVHLIALARHLGLRRLEALMSGKDLAMWRDALKNGETTLCVLRGAKNMRPRSIEVLESRRADTLAAIEAALEYAVAHDYEFITARRKTLESAINKLTTLLRKAGMTGELSFHSLRYTYALDLAQQLLASGVAPYETLVRLSEALGHGRSRTQMIQAYYCQPIADSFKGCAKLARYEAHRRRPGKKVPRATARLENKLTHARLSGFPVGQMNMPDSTTPARPARVARRKGSRKRPGARVRPSWEDALRELPIDPQVG